MMRGGLVALAVVGGLGIAGAASAQEEGPLPKQTWSFSGPFGTFDRAAAQRGYQVYKNVCSNCHSLKQGSYRNLIGIGLSPEQVTATAASVTVPTLPMTARRRSGRGCRRIFISGRPSPMRRPPGRRITAPCRPIFR